MAADENPAAIGASLQTDLSNNAGRINAIHCGTKHLTTHSTGALDSMAFIRETTLLSWLITPG